MRSRARLVVAAPGDTTRVVQARAGSPQRWTTMTPARDGWTEVSHQLIGDGAFGGDKTTTTVMAGAGSRLVLRGITATPLRGPERSVAALHLNVEPRAHVIYLPGALIPHAGADHVSAFRSSVMSGGSLVAVSILTPGRTGMGEYGAFARLRMRNSVRYGRREILFDDATLEGQPDLLGGAAILGGAGATFTAIAVGASPMATESSWGPVMAVPNVLAAVAPLPRGGVLMRALCRSLGDAQALLCNIERAARQAHCLT